MDRFVKHRLKVKYYIRYADDFVVLSRDRYFLERLIPKMENYLGKELKLKIHPNKILIKTVSSGIDFLGWVNYPKYRILRTSTKKRMYKRTSVSHSKESRQSYLGLLKHGNTYKIREQLEQLYTGTNARPKNE